MLLFALCIYVYYTCLCVDGYIGTCVCKDIKVKVDIGNFPKLLFRVLIQSSSLNGTQSMFASLLQRYPLSISCMLEFRWPHPSKISVSSSYSNSSPHIYVQVLYFPEPSFQDSCVMLILVVIFLCTVFNS